jgi:hypothetical protein
MTVNRNFWIPFRGSTGFAFLPNIADAASVLSQLQIYLAVHCHLLMVCQMILHQHPEFFFDTTMTNISSFINTSAERMYKHCQLWNILHTCGFMGKTEY